MITEAKVTKKDKKLFREHINSEMERVMKDRSSLNKQTLAIWNVDQIWSCEDKLGRKWLLMRENNYLQIPEQIPFCSLKKPKNKRLLSSGEAIIQFGMKK